LSLSLSLSSSLPSPLAHPDLLHRILSFADTPTLSTCLRVNSTFFELSGKLLYRSITSPSGKHIFLSEVLKGAAIKTRTRSTRAGPPQKNFKTRLLKHVRVLEARIGPLHQQCHLPDVQAGCEQLVALKTLRLFTSDFGEYDQFDMSEIRCGSLNSCPLQRIPPRRVVINDMAVCADPCTYARLFQTAEPSITFVFRSLFDSWNEAMKLQLLHAHLPPPKDHSPGGDRGRGCKTVRILFIGESGVDADTLDVSPDEEEALWDTATDCLSQLLNCGVEIYLLADPDRRTIIHEDIYGLEKVLEIDYFNAELEKKAGERLDPERLQCRADYLRLDDTADELDEATMDRLRQDEAAYRRRMEQGAGAGGN
jgi:hypothetical protein